MTTDRRDESREFARQLIEVFGPDLARLLRGQAQKSDAGPGKDVLDALARVAQIASEHPDATVQLGEQVYDGSVRAYQRLRKGW